LLKRVDTKVLVQKGLLDNINKHKLVIINEKHRIRQGSLLGEHFMGEGEYVKLLEKWLTYEKEYIDEVIPLMNAAPHVPPLAHDTEIGDIIQDSEPYIGNYTTVHF
jgi:hypothetical protein